MLVAALVIFFLILLTGLYVAAEFAAVGARRSRLRRLAEDGNALAARILPVVEDAHELDRYIAVSQVGITLRLPARTLLRRSRPRQRSSCSR